MRSLVFASLCMIAAACSFQPGVLGGDAPSPGDDARIDAPSDGVSDVILLDAPADSTVVQPSTTMHAAAADTWLSSVGPDTNLDSDELITDGDPQRVAVIRFDLTGISTQATVTAAQLRIATWDDAGTTVSFYPVLESWDETTTTWNVRTTNTAWSTAGAAPPSRGATAVGSVVPSAQFTEYFVTITPATVGGWVANPGTNFGLALVTTDANGTRFAASEHANATYHPYLRVTHVP